MLSFHLRQCLQNTFPPPSLFSILLVLQVPVFGIAVIEHFVYRIINDFVNLSFNFFLTERVTILVPIGISPAPKLIQSNLDYDSKRWTLFLVLTKGKTMAVSMVNRYLQLKP